jgi:hypothetical protein
VHDYTDVKPKISIVPAGIVVKFALLLASGYIVGSYHQAFAGGHRGQLKFCASKLQIVRVSLFQF